MTAAAGRSRLPVATTTALSLQPFRRDPVLRWFLARPAWVTPLFFAALYGLLVLATLIDGTFFSIAAPEGRYPADAQLVPLIDERFGLVFVLLFYPALVLYARVLDGRIRDTFEAMYKRNIFKADQHPAQMRLYYCQRRFDLRRAWFWSAFLALWFVAFWVSARLGWLDQHLRIVAHVSCRDSVAGFAWIIAFTLLATHLFGSVLWRIWVCARLLHKAFGKSQGVHLQPLHPDNCCGLRFVGDFTLLMSGFVAFFPIFLALLVWFYPRFLDNTVTGWALVYLGAGLYVLVATLVFVFPAYSAHRLMFREREDALEILNKRFFTTYEHLFKNLDHLGDRPRPEPHAVQPVAAAPLSGPALASGPAGDDGRIDPDDALDAVANALPTPAPTSEQATIEVALERQVKLLNNIREYYREVRSRAIWPFNVRVISEFAGVIGVPLLLLFLERLTP